MTAIATLVRPTYWLVDDERVNVPIKRGGSLACRVRIWRAKDVPAVVLASPLKGHASPRRATTRLANVVLSQYLAHWPKGMHFFECHAGELFHVDFLAFGCEHRLRLSSPKRYTVCLADLLDLLGITEGTEHGIVL